MGAYWLVPVDSDAENIVFGKERLLLEPGAEAESFRARLYGLHPRLLPMYKAALLLEDEADGSCGSEGDPQLLLSQDGELKFGQAPLLLSHCAEAFLDRLSDPREALDWLAAESEQQWTLTQQSWVDKTRLWWSTGRRVMLLKGE